MDLLIVLGAIAAVATLALTLTKRETAAPVEAEDASEAAFEDAAEEVSAASTECIRAEITAIRHDIDPATLKRWTSLTCLCEDGQTRRMTFFGENGVHLHKGGAGLLEHRQGSFVSFTKDTGEVVGVFYHIPAEAEAKEHD